MSRSHRGPSESQANADALARRDAPYSAASEASFRVAFDVRYRQPRDINDAVERVLRAYADDVPTKLHEGPDSIGEGGTPKMTERAEGYLFGSAESDDAKRDPDGLKDAISYYRSPFRACLAVMRSGNERSRKQAEIVAHVAIGSQRPSAAAVSVGVPYWCAMDVAEQALRAFMHNLSDVKFARPKESAVA